MRIFIGSRIFVNNREPLLEKHLNKLIILQYIYHINKTKQCDEEKTREDVSSKLKEGEDDRMNESEFLPVPNEEIPTHSTPIKASIPPFSTRKKAQSRRNEILTENGFPPQPRSTTAKERYQEIPYSEENRQLAFIPQSEKRCSTQNKITTTGSPKRFSYNGEIDTGSPERFSYHRTNNIGHHRNATDNEYQFSEIPQELISGTGSSKGAYCSVNDSTKGHEQHHSKSTVSPKRERSSKSSEKRQLSDIVDTYHNERTAHSHSSQNVANGFWPHDKKMTFTSGHNQGLSGNHYSCDNSHPVNSGVLSEGVDHMMRSNEGHENHNVSAAQRADKKRQPDFSKIEEIQNTTVCKQRNEIQLLVNELRDRDRELNDMASAHQQQLMAWEQDRHRILTLEQKLAKAEGMKQLHSTDDVQYRTKQLRTAISKLKAIRNESSTQNSTLETTQEQLTKLYQENDYQGTRLQELEEKNRDQNDRIKDMSTTIGQLQAREQELSTVLRLKEKDIVSATSQLKELGDRLKQLDLRSKECQDREAASLKQANHWKEKYQGLRQEQNLSQELMKKKDEELQQQMLVAVQIRQQLASIQEEFCQREKCKDEFIESMRAKQTRTDQQIRHLRELYDRQQREMSLLQLNLDSSKEVITKQQSSLEEYSSRSCSNCSKLVSELSPHQSQEHSIENSRKNIPSQNKYDEKSSQKPVKNDDRRTNMNYKEQYPTVGSHDRTSSKKGRCSYGDWPDERENNLMDLSLEIKSITQTTKPLTPLKTDVMFSKRQDIEEHRNVIPWETQNSINTENCSLSPVPHRRAVSPDPGYRHQKVTSDDYNTGNKVRFKGSPEGHQDTAKSDNISGQSSQYTSSKTDNILQHRGNQISSQPAFQSDSFSQHRNHHIYSQFSRKKDIPFQREEQRVSFEDQLSVFLEDRDNFDHTERKVPGQETENSPATKLQKLLLESRKMIENLEKSASPARNLLETFEGEGGDEKEKSNETAEISDSTVLKKQTTQETLNSVEMKFTTGQQISESTE